ncbi:MAG: SCO family protein [Burkholderiaceae bacterium]|nr:SCO family protein [Burkholderiaceae bacterium]
MRGWLAILALAAPPAAAHDARAPAAPELAPAPKMAVIRQAPEFTLLDPHGKPVQLGELRGRVVLLAFVYTTCTGACPLLSARMARLQARLIDAGLADRVALLSVTVDPERDTPEALARYARKFDARPGWHFLRDGRERMQAVLAAYDEWTRPLPDGDIDHPARLHLIDGEGRVREIYSLSFFDEWQAYLDIAALLREDARPPAASRSRAAAP